MAAIKKVLKGIRREEVTLSEETRTKCMCYRLRNLSQVTLKAKQILVHCVHSCRNEAAFPSRKSNLLSNNAKFLWQTLLLRTFRVFYF